MKNALISVEVGIDLEICLGRDYTFYYLECGGILFSMLFC